MVNNTYKMDTKGQSRYTRQTRRGTDKQQATLEGVVNQHPKSCNAACDRSSENQQQHQEIIPLNYTHSGATERRALPLPGSVKLDEMSTNTHIGFVATSNTRPPEKHGLPQRGPPFKHGKIEDA